MIESAAASSIFMAILQEFNRRAKNSLTPNSIRVSEILAEQFRDFFNETFQQAEEAGVLERDKDFETAILCVTLCQMLEENMEAVRGIIDRAAKPN